jgi:hypothetical protein
MTANGSATSRELARRYFVIAGLDPAIHPLRKNFFRWMRGS